MANGEIKVCVVGCCGRMGREVVKAVSAHQRMRIVAGVDLVQVGEDVGAIAGIGEVGIKVQSDLRSVLKESNANVAVEFTHPSATFENAMICIECGVAPVIGTTGWTQEMVSQLRDLCERYGVPAVIAPNFAIGAVLMMKFASEAAKYFDHVEIIELHHDRKADAPSGTALRTAELMLQARGKPFSGPSGGDTHITLPEVRGGSKDGIRIHSVRLPGLVAHQEVIFGGYGQVLTIRHDSLGRESFMPGVLLAIERVLSLRGLIYGLEHLL
ncbi:MAG: 4-hydroxy-tetrahydrodipicolinate reductase [Armatimonadota bacterium]|nr:4-hydroxy-tetrahydrodipicolinate reductase [Armatimonadota bacterium]MCX7777324.1 4-hydroxy-tetrahydrodipicolinate reductase [Armatimonadota bacterium]MDW8024358.1 4-hydroxy-tetrahydrodipicolinate reductase [Armatimonadota bacterium]